MEEHVTGTISALRLGSAAKFQDRWSGTVTAIEVTEDWEVVNVVVERGFLFFQDSIRLPLSAATSWSDEHVAFGCTSMQAFTHEVPPVAVPSRPVSAETPLSTPGARFAGALVAEGDRKVAEIIISRGIAGLNRIKVTEVGFEGKTLALAQQPDTLPRYRPDAEILGDIHRAIREDTGLTGDDKRGLTVTIDGGTATIGGNVRVGKAAQRAVAIAANTAGVAHVEDRTHDDISLETAIGLALDRSGVARHSEVFARSSIGEVQLYGYVPSSAAGEDVMRAVGSVPGVRNVISRLVVRAAA
jgi:osmotically-inducible protein OsmY